MLQCLWHEGRHGFAAGEPAQAEAEELPAKGSPQTTPTAPGCSATGVLGRSVAQTIAVVTTVGGFGDFIFLSAGKRVLELP